MLSSRRLDRRGEGTEYVAGGAVERQQRLALKPPQRRKAFLPHARVFRRLCTEFELGYRDGRKKDWLLASQRCHICGCQNPLFDIDPRAGVDQEAHGSRTLLFSVARFGLYCRLSVSQPSAASPGSVR